MKKPDLLVLVIVWQFLSAFMALIGLLSVAIVAFPDATASMWGSALPGFIFGIGIVVLVLLSYIIISIIAAVGIIKNKEWGRIMGIVQAALSIFGPPVGTIAGILILVYLLRPDIEAFFKTNNVQ
jgi:MFS family permease